MVAGPDNLNDPQIFQSVFNAHAESVRNFLYFRCKDLTRAEDLTQEAFLKLWQNRHKVPQAKAKSYIFTVANNLFLDEVKHLKVVFKYQQQHKVANTTSESPQYVLEEKEFHARLQAAVSQLPEKSRVVFLMNRVEKLSYKEIAERLEISVKAVEKRMSRALKTLRPLSEKI